VITFMGLQLGRLLSGAVVVETIFARQGLGKLLIDAILRRISRWSRGPFS
jgi:peptide/nickel transport system permease protein